MSIPKVKGYDRNYVRPKDDINPKVKQKSPTYSLEMSQFIYSQYLRNATAITESMLTRFGINRSYAEGRQSTTKYRNWILGVPEKEKPTFPGPPDDTQRIVKGLIEEDIAENQLNFDDVFSPLPKYVANIIGIMDGVEHDITVEAEDENSGTMREEMKYQSWIKNELAPLLARFDTHFDIPDLNEEAVKPASLEELELFDNIGAFKLPYEIAMEKLLAHTEFISDYERIKDDVVTDLTIQGFSSTCTFQDPNTGKVIHKHIPIEDVILENSKKNDFKDSTFGGYIEYYTIHQLRSETGLDEDELLSLASNARGSFLVTPIILKQS